MAQLATLGQQLEDWLKTAKLTAKQKADLPPSGSDLSPASWQSEGSYVRLQGQGQQWPNLQLALGGYFNYEASTRLSQYQQPSCQDVVWPAFRAMAQLSGKWGPLI